MAGCTTWVGHACDTVTSQTVTSSRSTFRMTIHPCQAGSRGWNKSSRSVVYGQLRDSTRSVTTSAVPLVVLTAAVGGSFFHSWILLITGLNFKNSLSRAAISATSTPNTIAK